MPSAPDRIREAVTAIQTWLTHTPNPGEAVVRQAIVLRLLHAAGFDIWNPAEVVPEETNAAGKRADFMVQTQAGKFALELKGMNVGLQPVDYQQAANYAGNKGTRWALLTNGKLWIVLDRTHNPGGTFQEHEVLKLEMSQAGDTFADDLARLLDRSVWATDACDSAVQDIQARQQQRLNEETIRLEKTGLVEELMSRYRIPTFELAAQNAVEMNRITEAERDVLLGCTPTPPPAPANARQRRPSKPEPTAHPAGRTPSGGIRFTYAIRGAEAHAVFDPTQGTWTVLAGSTALNRVLGEGGTNAQGIIKRRGVQLEERKLAERNVELLEFLADVTYLSPSTAAVDIAGSSINGWDAWKDDQGRSAQHHRPVRD